MKGLHASIIKELNPNGGPTSKHNYRICCCCCSVAKLYTTLCDPTDCRTPGFPFLQYLPELAQIHIHWVSDAIQPSHPLPPPSLFCQASHWQQEHLEKGLPSSVRSFCLSVYLQATLWKEYPHHWQIWHSDNIPNCILPSPRLLPQLLNIHPTGLPFSHVCPFRVCSPQRSQTVNLRGNIGPCHSWLQGLLITLRISVGWVGHMMASAQLPDLASPHFLHFRCLDLSAVPSMCPHSPSLSLCSSFPTPGIMFPQMLPTSLHLLGQVPWPLHLK